MYLLTLHNVPVHNVFLLITFDDLTVTVCAEICPAPCKLLKRKREEKQQERKY